jgi:lysophospholipase L1-like esterase
VPAALGLGAVAAALIVATVVRPAAEVSPAIPTGAPAHRADGGGIVFVGASYTAGLGAHPHTDGYAYLVGRDLGEPVEVDAISGTGFTNSGPRHQGTFDDRIRHLPRDWSPHLLVLQGGRNDVGWPVARLGPAVADTLTEARSRFPQAGLAVIGPIPGTLPISPALRAVNRVLAGVCRSDHVLFIDAIGQGWISPDNVRRFAGSVPQHPNNAGYAYIASHVAAALRPLLATDR